MSSISAQDLQRLAGLQGYDLTLEIDALARKYAMSPDEIMSILRSASQSQQPSQQPFEPVASKTVPQLPNQPNHISMEGLHLTTTQRVVRKIDVHKLIRQLCVRDVVLHLEFQVDVLSKSNAHSACMSRFSTDLVIE